MVIPKKVRNERGMLATDLLVAMGILVIALIPISFSYLNEQKLARVYYEKALVMQIIDGEMEVLAAGEWREFPEGERNYTIESTAAKNLPAGDFIFARDGKRLSLEWRPENSAVGSVSRKAIGQ